MRFTLATIVATLAAAASVSAHGYLSSPTCRGCQKASYQVDDLKSPNSRGLCRGEPAGPVHQVVGNKVTLGFTITAPHKGPCAVKLLDESLQEVMALDTREDCAAPGMVRDWTVQIPPTRSGRHVLRWTWEGCHVSPCEPYEQCVDINIGGGAGGQKSDAPAEPAPIQPTLPVQPVKSSGSKPKPVNKPLVPVNPGYDSAPPPSGGACAPGSFTCNGNRVGQCAAGQWIWTTCNAGTTCTSNGYTHYCA